jgi:hypothetical protein
VMPACSCCDDFGAICWSAMLPAASCTRCTIAGAAVLAMSDLELLEGLRALQRQVALGAMALERLVLRDLLVGVVGQLAAGARERSEDDSHGQHLPWQNRDHAGGGGAAGMAAAATAAPARAAGWAGRPPWRAWSIADCTCSGFTPSTCSSAEEVACVHGPGSPA